MTSRIQKAIQEDTRLCESSPDLWNIRKRLPEIRQIYGSYLPPPYLKSVKGFVAKDFAFPADAVIPKLLSKSIDGNAISRLFMIGEKIKPSTLVRTSDSVKIRAERNGAVIYTSYYSGFYLNEAAYGILKLGNDNLTVERIASELGYEIETIVDFLARALALGIVDVHT